MARMYSGKKGKSGSKKPAIKRKQTWIRYTSKEIESLVLKVAKTTKTASKIGLILRDSYGVSDVKSLTNKTITKILRENKLSSALPEDLVSLIRKEVKLMKHLEANKKDMTAKRGIQLTESKINRLVKYYKENKVLPADWKFEKEKARLLVD